MFNNPYIDQYRYDSSKSSGNEDDDMFGLNETINVDDVIIPYVLEFEDESRFIFTIFHDWTLSHKLSFKGFDLAVDKHSAIWVI